MSTHMPVAKGPSFDIRSAAIFGGVAVVAAIVIGIVAIQLGSRSNTLILGDTDFSSLSADNMAAEIAENGPILFPDIASGNRDIWLQHTGATPGVGWAAFDAREPGEGRECNVTWDVAARTFTNPCTGREFDESGSGLPEIPVYLDRRTVIVDLNGIRDPEEFSGYSG